MSLLPGGLLPGGLLPGATALSDRPPLVAPRTARTAQFLTTGRTSANFTRPTVSASFAQADAFVIRP